jgi:hypothetical protein
MNLFSCGDNNNTCLWILILLLLAASTCGRGLDSALSGSCIPILIALLFTMWRNGTLSSIFCGNGGGNGCGCNG